MKESRPIFELRAVRSAGTDQRENIRGECDRVYRLELYIALDLQETRGENEVKIDISGTKDHDIDFENGQPRNVSIGRQKSVKYISDRGVGCDLARTRPAGRSRLGRRLRRSVKVIRMADRVYGVIADV